jgi:hypothetical protein
MQLLVKSVNILPLLSAYFSPKNKLEERKSVIKEIPYFGIVHPKNKLEGEQ